ncbi:hypothetical protein B0H63DRAFT_448197 [Podospora didyma]|uniref:CENP-V/GFA domain-containing protein n=1 Tax=Podospora didyma TaxID=330526 RepID=A0AAE0NTU9_9PEZI|nr:hypothetical protein B0H63DRAFT_448197 [Podospora didyma]
MANSQRTNAIKGSCFCSNITYEMEGEPATKARVIVPVPTFHSRLAQNGALSSRCTAPVAPEKFRITSSGQPKIYQFTHPAGFTTDAAFCGDCGTWLYKQVEADPWRGYYFVQAGTTGHDHEMVEG